LPTQRWVKRDLGDGGTGDDWFSPKRDLVGVMSRIQQAIALLPDYLNQNLTDCEREIGQLEGNIILPYLTVRHALALLIAVVDGL